jgi:parallel beta-helix repeat protein
MLAAASAERLGVSRRSFLSAGACVLGAGLLNACSANESSVLIKQAGVQVRELQSVDKRTQFHRLVKCGGSTLYVAGSGLDSNDGSPERPFRQISAAIRSARPGTLILVDSGIYGRLDVRGFSGEPSNWLGIMTVSDDTRAYITVPSPTSSFVNIVGSSYIGLYGFEIMGDQDNPNTNCSGISVYGNSHHIALWANVVHDFPAGGINCFDADGSQDMVDASYNRIYRTSRYSPNNTSGISIFASRDLTSDSFTGGYGHRLVGNYIYDVLCTVPFFPGGYDYVTDGNGISLDKILAIYGYRKPILVRDNVVTGCGGRGIYAYQTVNVDVYNNTAIGNLRTNSPAISGGVEIEGTIEGGVTCVSNVICPLNTPNSTDRVSKYHHNVILGGTQGVPAQNFDLRNEGLHYFVGPITRRLLIAGSGSVSRFMPS